MTPKLQKLIDDTASELVTKNDDCLFNSSKIKTSKAILTKFAEAILAEVEPTPPPTS